MKYRVTAAGRSLEIEVDHDRLVRVNGQPMYVHLEQVSQLPIYTLALDGAGYVVFVEDGQGQYEVEIDGHLYPVEVQAELPQFSPGRPPCPPGDQACTEVIYAPLAGTLVSLPLGAGRRIEAGQVVAVVESMKMQMELRAPRAGVIQVVAGPPGRSVGQGEELVIIRTG